MFLLTVFLISSFPSVIFYYVLKFCSKEFPLLAYVFCCLLMSLIAKLINFNFFVVVNEVKI